MSKKKCWLSITMWYPKILQDGLYVLYTIYIVMNDQEPMYHFDFNMLSPLDWIDTDYYCPNKNQMYQVSSSNNGSKSKTCTSWYSNTSTYIIKIYPKLTKEKTWNIYGNICMHIHGRKLNQHIQNVKNNAICWLHHWLIVSERNFSVTSCTTTFSG